jgi:hypothetical protein
VKDGPGLHPQTGQPLKPAVFLPSCTWCPITQTTALWQKEISSKRRKKCPRARATGKDLWQGDFAFSGLCWGDWDS